MGEGTRDGRGSPTGVKPGAPTDLVRQVAATPEERAAEPPPLLPGAVVGRFEILRELGRQVALKVGRPGTAVVDEGKVARWLAHAHAEGVVHRDLKPSNERHRRGSR